MLRQPEDALLLSSDESMQDAQISFRQVKSRSEFDRAIQEVKWNSKWAAARRNSVLRYSQCNQNCATLLPHISGLSSFALTYKTLYLFLSIDRPSLQAQDSESWRLLTLSYHVWPSARIGKSETQESIFALELVKAQPIHSDALSILLAGKTTPEGRGQLQIIRKEH